MKQADKLVKQQAIKREYDRAARQKREPHFPQGEGHSIVGSIYDCNRAGFERALKSYWSRLYVGWNPFKKDGRGCWEVWQTPSRKTAKIAYKDDNMTIITSEYESSDFEHWVADLDFLSYDFIKRLREMDGWENKQLIAQHDEKYEQHFIDLEKQEDDNIKYIVKNNKQVFRDLLDYTQSGFNPLDFFNKK